MFECFVITLLKWMKYKNRLTFAYYSITFWDLKSLQSVPKTWQVLKTKRKLEILLKMSWYRNAVFYDYQSRFLLIFSSNYRHRLVMKIPFIDHIFFQNLEIPYWKPSFPVHLQILCSPHTKFYVPIVTLWTQDNATLLQQLKSEIRL